MKITAEKEIDNIYLLELQDIADWYGENIDFALKQCISTEHAYIRGWENYGLHDRTYGRNFNNDNL